MAEYGIDYLKNAYKNLINYNLKDNFKSMYNNIINSSFIGPNLGDYSEESFNSPSLSYLKRLPPLTKQEMKYKFFN